MEEFYLATNRHKIRVFRAFAQIIAWRQSAEFSKVIDKVGLIVVAAASRDLGPGQGAGLLNLVDRALKSKHAAKFLWCNSYLLGEDFDEPSPAETDLSSHFADRGTFRRALERFECVTHGAMTRSKSAPADKKRILENAELGRSAGASSN